MIFYNFTTSTTVYFEDHKGNNYRASSPYHIERLWGESWESEYSLEDDKDLRKMLMRLCK